MRRKNKVRKPGRRKRVIKSEEKEQDVREEGGWKTRKKRERDVTREQIQEQEKKKENVEDE